MRLDGVEVKVSLDRDQTPEAVQILQLPEVRPWKIFFVEDVTVGLGAGTPLLDRRLIIRARQRTGGADDVTVKFRPGRRSQLTDSWLDAKAIKVEADWSAGRRSLSISLTAERPDGLVADVAAGDRDVQALLTGDQQRLVDRCAEVRVNLDTLTMLPAVTAQRWPAFAVAVPGRPALDVRAERWTVLDLDFLELSIAVDVEQAEAAQAALLAFVAGRGLHPSDDEAKTTLVLQRLVAVAAQVKP